MNKKNAHVAIPFSNAKWAMCANVNVSASLLPRKKNNSSVKNTPIVFAANA